MKKMDKIMNVPRNSVWKFDISAHWGTGRRGRDKYALVHQYWVGSVYVGTSVEDVWLFLRRYAVAPVPTKKLVTSVCMRAKTEGRSFKIEATGKGWREYPEGA